MKHRRRRGFAAAALLAAMTLVCGSSISSGADDEWYGITQIAQDGKKVNLYVSLPEGVDIDSLGNDSGDADHAAGNDLETLDGNAVGNDLGDLDDAAENSTGSLDGSVAKSSPGGLDGAAENAAENLSGGLDGGNEEAVAADTFTVTVNGESDLAVQEASVFSTLGEGTCYVFVVDISKSLTEEEMQQIQSALTSFVGGLGSDDRMQIITAGEGAETLLNKPVHKKTKLKEAIAQSVRRTANYTWLYPAIWEALETRSTYADTLPERMAVVAITDGKDTSDGEVSLETLREELLETRVPLYVIGVQGNDSSANLDEIRALVELSGGIVISDGVSGENVSIQEAVETVRSVVKESVRLTIQPTEDLFALGEWSWTVSCRLGADTSTSVPYVYPLSLKEALADTEMETDLETVSEEGESAGDEGRSGTESSDGTESETGTISGNVAGIENEDDGSAGGVSGGEAGSGVATGNVTGATGEDTTGSETGAGSEDATGSDAGVDNGGAAENVTETGSSDAIENVTGAGSESGNESGGKDASEGAVETGTGDGLQSGTEMGGIFQFAQSSRITCIAAVLIVISLILMLASLILWKKCRNFGDAGLQKEPIKEAFKEPLMEPPYEDGYETLTSPGFPGNEETADFPDAFDDEETIDELEGMGVRLCFEITFDGRTEVTEHILREQLVLGRGTECDVDVVLQSAAPERKRISRHHAYILNHADGLSVRDNEKNKTWLNGAEVAGECPLRDGDILRMAGATVKVRIL
ncbi:MAG: VWA domain-containing protein [Lachnospiraceae bacterium]|nr:VWA domain-containing protein [Lachnospiraceae bacterium]